MIKNKNPEPIKKLISIYNFETPITLNIGLEKLKDINNPDGDQKRYFSVFINDTDVTREIAALTGKNLSKYGSIIMHGCGMDMFFALYDDIRKSASICGEEGLFDGYQNIGKRQRDGSFPYIYAVTKVREEEIESR